MPKEAELRRLLDEEDLIRWREATMTADKDALEAAFEKPATSNPLCFAKQQVTNFPKSNIKPIYERKQSLLTKALQPGQEENGRPQIYTSAQMERHRSTRSNASTTSTVDLISDSGLTSPSRTSTPSPPFPNSTYTSFAPYTLGPKLAKAAQAQLQQPSNPTVLKTETTTTPQLDPAVEALVKKRTISFACGRPKEPVRSMSELVTEAKAAEPPAPPKRTIKFACPGPQVEKKVAAPVAPVSPEKAKPSIKFACPGPQPEKKGVTLAPVSPEKAKPSIKFACPGPQPEKKGVTLAAVEKTSKPTSIPTAPLKVSERLSSRSPSMSRKPRSSTPSKSHRDSTSTVRRASQSPEAFRSRKPKFIAADNEDLLSSEARFHEFASDEPQDDDWIREDTSHTKVKITINDTLKKENAIRQLAEEAEEEALEDEEDDEDEDNDDDDEDEDDDDEDDETDGDEDDIEDEEEVGIALHDDDQDTIDGSIDDIDYDASDGNESDNEAGFADSDDDNDPMGEYAFWTPGKMLFASSGEANTFRPSLRHRAPSDSSIDSLSHMSPLDGMKKTNRMKPSRKIRIRPGTPDLPDSTDFVCGTLDEDRPLEEAYISCMEARRREKHHLIPQDIDPSFPTSDPEEEEDEVDDVEQEDESDEAVWLHGKFEDSDSETRRRRRQRKSPKHSPKRMHSPPPATKHRSPPPPTRHRSPPPTTRHRSPPPTKRRSPPATRHHSPPPPRGLFLNSPRSARPVPSQIVHSPPASFNAAPSSVMFAPLGIRPGLTHTKSLPRRPNGFTNQYARSRLEAAIDEEGSDNDGHTRGAIDIVKGLEQKRERRKEKFYSKLCHKARKGHVSQRRPTPGKGAERMKELGLQMAGKTVDHKTGKAEYVLSV